MKKAALKPLRKRMEYELLRPHTCHEDHPRSADDKKILQDGHYWFKECSICQKLWHSAPGWG